MKPWRVHFECSYYSRNPHAAVLSTYYVSGYEYVKTLQIKGGQWAGGSNHCLYFFSH